MSSDSSTDLPRECRGRAVTAQDRAVSRSDLPRLYSRAAARAAGVPLRTLLGRGVPEGALRPVRHRPDTDRSSSARSSGAQRLAGWCLHQPSHRRGDLGSRSAGHLGRSCPAVHSERPLGTPRRTGPLPQAGSGHHDQARVAHHHSGADLSGSRGSGLAPGGTRDRRGRSGQDESDVGRAAVSPRFDRIADCVLLAGLPEADRQCHRSRARLQWLPRFDLWSATSGCRRLRRTEHAERHRRDRHRPPRRARPRGVPTGRGDPRRHLRRAGTHARTRTRCPDRLRCARRAATVLSRMAPPLRLIPAARRCPAQPGRRADVRAN